MVAACRWTGILAPEKKIGLLSYTLEEVRRLLRRVSTQPRARARRVPIPRLVAFNIVRLAGRYMHMEVNYKHY